MDKTVLVTGGTGFVGAWCIVELLRQGYRVRTTVRSAARQAGVRHAVAREIEPGDRLEFTIADLTSDAGWAEAMTGCDYVLHVASPMTSATADPQALIAPAREGTLRVLKAAVDAGVQRVVMTSSCATVNQGLQSGDTVNDETMWASENDPDLNAYRLSKILAERAAWDFMREHGGATEFATVLPSAIFGPVLTLDNPGSVQLVQRQLQGKMPGTPNVGFCVVDVRDLALAHVEAMRRPEAAGERFIVAGEFVWMRDVAAILRQRLGERAAKVPTRGLPDWLVKLMGRFVPAMQQLVPMLGRRHLYRSDKAQRLLGYRPRPAADTLVECAESLLVLEGRA
ncbi:aldehyde reductase [Thermomonas sp. HDW16]|uniref:SDR family oxidoreductase n=1 Tax=Thermomonas sp. HDW16 TaxID=2714945 RepID=UPI0014076F54|nr:aldehyde reductase [Thermomonas sp. HDW16]QIL20616.1 aldehyde reductase [Thermomonas sp. HDW16]